MTEAARLKAEIAKGEAAKQSLLSLQNRCSHNWTNPVYDPEVSGGYRTEGDVPGTMGVDFRGPQYIPREEKPRWFRKCLTCDKTDYTYDTKVVATAPVFR
jgi:hypothetical protein